MGRQTKRPRYVTVTNRPNQPVDNAAALHDELLRLRGVHGSRAKSSASPQEHELFRLIAEHDAWLVPATLQGGELLVVRDPMPEGHGLTLFSSPGVLDSCRAHWPLDHTLKFLGALFASEELGRRTLQLRLDPCAPHVLYVKGAAIRRLRQMAQAVIVEKILVDSLTVRNPGARLRRFAGWRVLWDDDALVLANDGAKRCAAVFTGEDCAQRFVQQRSALRAPPARVEVLSGHELVLKLSESGLDGVYFNCAGPAPAVERDLAWIQKFDGP